MFMAIEDPFLNKNNKNNNKGIKRAQVPAIKEPVNLMQQDGKMTLFSWGTIFKRS